MSEAAWRIGSGPDKTRTNSVEGSVPEFRNTLRQVSSDAPTPTDRLSALLAVTPLFFGQLGQTGQVHMLETHRHPNGIKDAKAKAESRLPEFVAGCTDCGRLHCEEMWPAVSGLGVLASWREITACLERPRTRADGWAPAHHGPRGKPSAP